mgnify:CR=1 FL=1
MVILDWAKNDYILTPEGDTLEVNFLIDYYYIANGDTFLEAYVDSITGEEGIGLNSKIPVLSNNAASDILEGEIEKKMNWFTDLLGRDTVFFRSTLYDNDGNASEVVQSPVFYYNSIIINWLYYLPKRLCSIEFLSISGRMELIYI